MFLVSFTKLDDTLNSSLVGYIVNLLDEISLYGVYFSVVSSYTYNLMFPFSSFKPTNVYLVILLLNAGISLSLIFIVVSS